MALFGTDGVRGVANRDLTPELAFRLGRAAVSVLGGNGRPRIVLGRDTRASGEFLEAALAAGICSAGGDVVRAGVVPTPAVAFLTGDLAADGGAVLSASHNPPEYNGIKLFASGGTKLPDDEEERIESAVEDPDGPRPHGPDVGRILDDRDAGERYLRHLAASVDGTLEGMKVLVDCAEGAAHRLGPDALRRQGAEVEAIHDRPDGHNINVKCGATHPEVIADAVRRSGADAGVAFDGDADRAIFADAQGHVVNGDHVLAACAVAMRRAGMLAGDTVVTTVMANLGFRRAMDDAGIAISETRVGDRYVLERMLELGAVLGGEQSGHVVFLDRATTGDGILTALRFLALARGAPGGVQELAGVMRVYPQVLLGVEVDDPSAVQDASAVWESVRAAEDSLGKLGRVLVRPSGTEPLVRVMVEAEAQQEAEKHAEAIAETVRAALSGP